MSLSTFFVFVSLLSLSNCGVSYGEAGRGGETCNLRASVFDRGLKKLLESDRFSKIDLPDFVENVNDGLLNVRAGFSGGTLRGISTIRRRGEGMLQVDESGSSRLTFHIVGGPLEAYYASGVRAWFLQLALDLRAHVPHFQASFTVQESSPNELRVEVHGIRMSRARLILDKDNINLDGAIYDIVFEQFKPLIQQKVGEALVRELQKVAAETLGAVKLYAMASAERTVREEDSSATRAWKHGYNAASSLLALMEGGRSHRSGTNAHSRSTGRTRGQRLDSYTARGQRQIGVFERFSVAQVDTIAGNVTGLSNVSTKGASWTSVGECGIRARFDLVFTGLRVNATASVSAMFMSRSVTFEMEIPEVEVILEIQETEDALQVTTYDLTFTSNVTVTASVEGTVGRIFDFFGGLSNVTLGDDDLLLIKSSSRRYVQQIAEAVRGFIADPPPMPMAQIRRGRPSVTFY
ncbi:hypothetical protein HPB52_019625 [Rhipicephalus sanguineus]|uniref:Uncharacterized protein n=1 Tax=Rhipicephalus sanguineus TaxID=34632 RepID=A0A9D4Q276_RHISA|nr:hypothetical protein HPB52_019625 [Rhipicephalus sanguineus]